MKIIFYLAAILMLFSACEGVQRISPSGLPYEAEREEPEQEDVMEEDSSIDRIIEISHTEGFDDGVLRLHMRPPATLNPLLNEDVTVAPILRLIFEPLAVVDQEFRVVGYLAELDFASDYSNVNATVRDGAIWSDGMPVTADDIIFSIEFLRAAPNGAIYKDLVGEIESAVRIDARTAQIIFTDASVMAGYSLRFPIIPQHYYQGQTNPRSENNMSPLGSGPFVFESLSPIRSMLLRRNSYHSRGGIDEVEVILLPDAETDFHAFDRGRIDAIHLPLTEWTRRNGVRSPAFEIFPAMYFEFIGFNYQKNFLRDIHTRQGIAHAFNAREAVSTLYLAHAVYSATPIHPHNWAADANILNPVHDPPRAAALLGTLRLSEPLVILANAENPQRVSIAERLAESLTEVGLPAIAEIVPGEEYFQRLEDYDFDLFIGGMQLPFAPDVQVFFTHDMFPPDPVLEAAQAAVRFASAEAAYLPAISQLQTAFIEQLPVIGLAFRHSSLLTSPRISVPLNPAPDHVFADIRSWEITAN